MILILSVIVKIMVSHFIIQQPRLQIRAVFYLLHNFLLRAARPLKTAAKIKSAAIERECNGV